MQSFSFATIIIGFVNAHHLVGMAGTMSSDIASPDTRINLGQMQKATVNIVGHGHGHGHGHHHHHHRFMTEYMPHVDHIEGELGHHIEQAGPAVVKGCYKVIPIYKTHYKQVEDFKNVDHQVKYMVPDFKTVKTYRTVERVVHDVVPEFKQVETMRPEYKTVTTQVPFTKTVAYKVRSYIKKNLPPTIIPDSHTEFIHHREYTPSIRTIGTVGTMGSPKIDVKVGSLSNYGQNVETTHQF